MKTKSIQLVLSLITIAVAAASPPADELLAQSRAALAANDAKLAVQLAEAAVQAEPARADLHAHLGGAYSVRISQVHLMHQAIMSGKMLSAFEQAVKLDPDHLGARQPREGRGGSRCDQTA